VDYVARVVAWRNRTGQSLDRDLWTEIAVQIACDSALLGHDSEVVWTTWLLKEIGQKLSKPLTDQIISKNSPIVIASLPHFHAHKMCADKKILRKLQDRVDGDSFSGSCWPLVLELNFIGKAKEEWRAHVGPPSLRVLFDSRASIIDWNAEPKVFNDRPETGSSLPWSPRREIEEIGSDYREDEADGNSIPSISRLINPFGRETPARIDDEFDF
jgi:hypothetical protein